jgi:probable F420-dependent oxidoreductase
MSAANTPRMKVGIVMPMAEDTDTGTTASYAEIRALAQATEAEGFDSVWAFDHLIYRFPDQPEFGIWEAWTIMTALAEATERVEIGSVVLCVPFRNPAVLAKMAATLDEVSQGRLILGLGAGWHEPEFDAFGLPFDHLATRFEEALNIIAPLLREGRVDYHGTYYQAPNCAIRPRGPRPNGPPIMIASKQPRMSRLTARWGDSWNTAWLGEPTLLPERRAALEAACAAEGRDPATLGITVGVSVTIPSEGEGQEEIDPKRTLAGTPANIARGWAAYEEEGVEHIMCWLSRTDEAAVRWLGEALRIFRRPTDDQ